MLLPIWLLLILNVLATCSLVELFRHGSLFAPLRAWIESRGAMAAEWIQCGFCFSYSAAAAVIFMNAVHFVFVCNGVELNPALAVIAWLAVTRCSNILNDITKSFTRTPSRTGLDVPDLSIKD